MRLTQAKSLGSGVLVRLWRAYRQLCGIRLVWVSILAAFVVLNAVVYLTYIGALFAHNDFRLYYAGAEIGLKYGWSHVYDVTLQQAAVAELSPAGPWYALLTPAPITWLVAPLTLLGYPTAYWVWVGASLAILGAALWYSRPRHLPAALYFTWWAALGPVWFSAYEGQVTMLIAAALLVGWRLLEARRDFLAGAILAVALFKPHLVLLLPVALLAVGRFRALLGFATVAAAVGVAMLVTLHAEGIQQYLTTLFGPQAAGDTAETLRSALGGGAPVLVIQAVVVIVVIAVALHARRTGAVGPAVSGALLGSFLLATYWHPQDYLVIAVAAAIILASNALRAGVPIAAAMVIVSMLAGPLNYRQTIFSWLLIAIVSLVFVGVLTLKSSKPRTQRASLAA